MVRAVLLPPYRPRRWAVIGNCWVRSASLTVVSHFVLFGRVGSRSGLSVAPFSLALCRSSSPARSGRFARPSARVSTRRCSGWPTRRWTSFGGRAHAGQPAGRRPGVTTGPGWPTRGGLAREHDAPNTRTWLRDHLRLGPGEAGRLPWPARPLGREHAHTVAEAVRALPAETPAEPRTATEQALGRARRHRRPRRIACQTHVIPAVLSGESLPLDLGCGSRHHVRAARRAIILRDRGCVFPGQRRQTRPKQTAWSSVHLTTAPYTTTAGTYEQ